MESLAIFGGAIVVGALAAVALSLYGIHLATRDSALQSLAISQGAQLGVLLTLGFVHSQNNYLPWFGGLFVAFSVSLLSDRVASRIRASKNTVFIVFFLILLASSYCLISVLPVLDSHHSQAFFGELVFLSGAEMYVLAIVSLISLAVLLFNFNKWCNRSFLLSTFGGDSLVTSRQDRGFLFISLILIVTSVFSVGLLLTLSALFIPSMVLSFLKKADLKKHFIACAMTAGLGVVFGFVLTLELEDYPTVPVVVLTFLLLSLASLFVLNLTNTRKDTS